MYIYIYIYIYVYIIHVYTRSEIVRRFWTLFNRFIRCQQDITVCVAKYVLSAVSMCFCGGLTTTLSVTSA